MNTSSHFLIAAALSKALRPKPIHRSAVLWGSVAPDLPLWILSLGGVAYYHWLQGLSLKETFEVLFDQLYFHNPFWIAAHNALHAPFLLIAGLAWTWRDRQKMGSLQRWLFWFLLSCLLHTAIDIPTHGDDGPLLLFPLNWTFRFNSPVSYWDPRHYGTIFRWVELTLDMGLLGYLLRSRFIRM
ncbi:MAG: zinc dependent phospholipase C family protein [Thermosynechococcaceae cyanobacterium]